VTRRARRGASNPSAAGRRGADDERDDEGDDADDRNEDSNDEDNDDLGGDDRDETMLTTIKTTNPIHANFDVDERTLLRVRRLIREGKVESARKAEVTVLLALADEEEFIRSSKSE